MSNYYICSFKSYQHLPNIVQRIRASSFSEAQDLFIEKNKDKLRYGEISAKLGSVAHGMTYDPTDEDEDYDEDDEDEEEYDEEYDDEDYDEFE